jgi:hypothetical protein
MAGKHRAVDQPGDRSKVLRTGRDALVKLARRQGIPDEVILKTVQDAYRTTGK